VPVPSPSLIIQPYVSPIRYSRRAYHDHSLNHTRLAFHARGVFIRQRGDSNLQHSSSRPIGDRCNFARLCTRRTERSPSARPKVALPSDVPQAGQQRDENKASRTRPNFDIFFPWHTDTVHRHVCCPPKVLVDVCQGGHVFEVQTWPEPGRRAGSGIEMLYE
jgi:hypothetical protein